MTKKSSKTGGLQRRAGLRFLDISSAQSLAPTNVTAASPRKSSGVKGLVPLTPATPRSHPLLEALDTINSPLFRAGSKTPRTAIPPTPSRLANSDELSKPVVYQEFYSTPFVEEQQYESAWIDYEGMLWQKNRDQMIMNQRERAMEEQMLQVQRMLEGYYGISSDEGKVKEADFKLDNDPFGTMSFLFGRDEIEVD